MNNHAFVPTCCITHNKFVSKVAENLTEKPASVGHDECNPCAETRSNVGRLTTVVTMFVAKVSDLQLLL